MTMRYQILCIDQSDSLNPHERITHLGGKNDDGTKWRITQQAAIEGVESGKHSFYVDRGGHTVDVIVAINQWGKKYIKTVNDCQQPDNLLSLPECPL